jgi:hypothetical protein
MMGEQAGGMANPRSAEPDAIAFSNGIRLTGRQWVGLGLFAILLLVWAPALWSHAERFALESDYRIPHDLSNDYWLYECFAGLAADHYETLVIGDSVVWGEYATRQETLSHYLNERAGRERFANLGLDGAHPLALGGLVEFYAERIAGKDVVLQCNPLWLSSRRADLQDAQANEFNHPRLVPQFAPSVPAYKAEISPRLGVLVERRLPWSRWATHLQQAYYDRTDIPGWTLEHPYDNPLTPLTRGLPPSGDSRRHLPVPWYKSGISRQDYPWVDLGTSLQWQAFRGVVEILQQRGNRVFVLVGPFNEHLLTPESLRRYHQVKTTIAAWLRAKKIPHAIPPPLPSDQYGDASHPLAEGYQRLAHQLAFDPFFQAAAPTTVGPVPFGLPSANGQKQREGWSVPELVGRTTARDVDSGMGKGAAFRAFFSLLSYPPGAPR